MDVLALRVLLRCTDLDRSLGFWRDTVGLSEFRSYGTGGRVLGVVLFCGGGYLELTGPQGDGPGPDRSADLWLQVPDVAAEAARLRDAGVEVDGPRREPWGLDEAWIADPDGHRAVLVEVPEDHPMRSRLTT